MIKQYSYLLVVFHLRLMELSKLTTSIQHYFAHEMEKIPIYRTDYTYYRTKVFHQTTHNYKQNPKTNIARFPLFHYTYIVIF